MGEAQWRRSRQRGRRLVGVAALIVTAVVGPVSAQAPQPQAPPQLRAVDLPSIAPLVEPATSAVVNVDVRTRAERSEEGPTGDEFFERFFGMPFPGPSEEPRIREGTGSGFIIDPRGLILTNNHVVEEAESIRVTLADGRSFEASVQGRDPLTDLALLRITEPVQNLPVVRLGDSDAVRVGDWVVAIGSPFGLTSSVSVGILSARARELGVGPYDDFLQTDAAINFGNSGGPLLNLRGEVIGINTAIVGGASGIGFAVPSNMARRLLPELTRGGEIRRGWLGVSVQDLTPDLARALNVSVSKGAVVAEVNRGTPAQRAGLRPNDVVVAINGRPVESAKALTRIVGFEKPGTRATLTVLRGGRREDVAIELGQRPTREELAQQEERQPPEQRREGATLGLSLEDVDPRYARIAGIPPTGALVTEVAPGSPAEAAGLERGMVVVEAAGRPVRNAEDLVRILRSATSGTTLLLRIQLSDGKVLRALRVP